MLFILLRKIKPTNKFDLSIKNRKKIKEEKAVTDDYIINGFKPFSQFAMKYFPCPSNVTTSRKRMRDKIDQDLSRIFALKSAGYTEHITYLTPKMQEIIMQCWGPPKIVVPVHPNGPEKMKH